MYTFCVYNSFVNNYECFGSWLDFNSLPDSAGIKAAAFFVGFSLIISILSLIVAFLCLLVKFERIFHVCAWLQTICSKFYSFQELKMIQMIKILFKSKTAISLLIGVTIYPIGWNSNVIRSVCGQEADQYHLGSCAIRWPYALAILTLLQIFFLTICSFLLAARQAKYILSYASKNRNNNQQGQ